MTSVRFYDSMSTMTFRSEQQSRLLAIRGKYRCQMLLLDLQITAFQEAEREILSEETYFEV